MQNRSRLFRSCLLLWLSFAAFVTRQVQVQPRKPHAYGGMKNCRIILSSLLLCLGLVARVAVADMAVSTNVITSDLPSTGSAWNPSISGDGRYVAFLYTFTNNGSDIYVHDRVTGINRTMTPSPTGWSDGTPSCGPRISRDGRYIVFSSADRELAASVMTGMQGVFVYDQQTRTVEWIGGYYSCNLGISADGRYVTYMLPIVLPGGVWAGYRTFLWDRVTQSTEQLNIPHSANGNISFSADGRYFLYKAERVFSGYSNTVYDMFVYDRETGSSEQVNVNSAGEVGNIDAFHALAPQPSMSADGRFVVFASASANLVANDTNDAMDVFVRDRTTGTTERVSVSSAGVQSALGPYGNYNHSPDISADGRYVVFIGANGNLDPSGDPLPGVFVRDRLTGTTRRIVSEYYAEWPVISADGRHVAYRISYTPTGPQMAIADISDSAVGTGSVTLSATSLALTEGGTAATYTISLANAPSANVIVVVSPGTQLAAAPTQLTFTPANWNAPQTVTVQALQDGIAEGSHTGTLTHTATSADPDYNGIAIGSVNVAISEAVIPVATLPVTDGVAWTRSDLPVTGTAAPGATVTVSATNLTTGTVSAVSAVADANGAWSLTLTGLASGNYTLQPDAGGVKGSTLNFALALSGGSGGSGSLPLILTGASLYDIDGAGNYVGNGWDTTGGNGAYNFYLLSASNAFLNSGNGAAASLNQDLSTPGTYTFLYRADGGGFNWPTPSAGLNLFFNNNTNPGISVSVPFNVPTPALTAFGTGSLGIVNADVVPGANALSFMAGDLKVTLTAFSLMDYQNPAVPPALPDLVSPGDTVPNGLNDYSGVITLQVARESASSGGLSPVLLLPGSGVWTQANLPLHGTAPAGSTVTLHVKNLHTNATGTYTAVAAADGTWSILVPDLEDCHYQLQAEINGLFGNQEVIYLDSHAPTTALSIGLAGGGSGGGGGGGTGTGGWYSGAISLGLSAVDDRFGHGVGVDRIEYSLNAGAWTVFPGTGLTLERDGIYNFCYRALDNAGNVEPVHCVPLWIDMTAPVVTPRFDGTRNVLSLDAVDGVSGIGSLEVSFDGGASWSNSTGVVSFPQGGTYTVHYRCRDNAGNVTTGQTTVTVITPWVPPNPPYQSNGGFITGGGQVNLAAGSAQFDFVVKYQKGDAVPKGNAQLQLTSGKFDFRSSSFDWLVTTPSQAWFAGSGTLNGTGDYGYLMSVIDIGSGSKSVDALRLKVWNKANGAVVYDTQPGAADMAEPTLLLSKGNITIHK
jgi:Tol biopolymer transport system component